jgi:lipid-A-disaccharide synthase-like uncharacterized protein
MARNDIFSKILAMLGTALSWFPILIPILFFVTRYVEIRKLNFDYMLPAELFPASLLGAGLLIWAALRAKQSLKVIGWGAGVAVGIITSQILAMVTGLASGEMEPPAWLQLGIVGLIVIYDLALVVIGVGGVLLLRELFKPAEQPATNDLADR